MRQGDDKWADIARWVLNALITAEELGVTQANVAEMAKGTDHPEINRMLGTEGSLGEMLGLDAEWAVRAIAAEGNYAEIFEKYLGAGSPLGLLRGLSALYSDGGILYSPPVPLNAPAHRAVRLTRGEGAAYSGALPAPGAG